MNENRYIEKSILGLGLMMIFSSSHLNSYEEYRHLREVFFLLGGTFIIIVTLSSLIKKELIMNNRLKFFTYVYGGFISLLMLSILVNQNFNVFDRSVEFNEAIKFSLVFLFLGIGIALTGKVNEKIIINSLILSSVTILIYFLIKYPVSEIAYQAYKGGFNNPNSIGVLGVTLFGVSFVAGTSLIKMKKRYLLASIYLLIAIGATYLTMISNSRTSFITLILLFAIISITFTYDILKARNLLTWKSILLLLLTAVGATSLFILVDNPIYATLETTILDKFSRKKELNLTDGRSDVWIAIIKSAGLFGQESGYYKNLVGITAHNSYLYILSVYGWFAFIAYIGFWFVMLIKSIRYYLTNKFVNTYALLPLVVIINYISLSMMENLVFNISAFLALSMVVIFSKTKESTLFLNV